MRKGLHLFERGDLVTRGDGIRGLVVKVDVLRAGIRWEDGRAEVIEQGEPSVWNEGTCRTWEAQAGGWNPTLECYVGAYVWDSTAEEILASHELWRVAGDVPMLEPESSDEGEDEQLEEAA